MLSTLIALLGLALLAPAAETPAVAANDANAIFARDNLIAWCIVPFDSKNRSPEDRAAMLQRLGFQHFAYDWRAEHIPSFDAEVLALRKHGVGLDAFWGPGVLNDDSKRILDLLKKHDVKAQLWVLIDQGADKVTGPEQQRRVEAAAAQIKPLAIEAGKIGCTVGLYNHGGWFGEPENQIAIIERLKKDGLTNLGLVYNLHHGHDHLLLCICNSGRRSLTAASLLRSLGYPKALSVAGGFQAWKKMQAPAGTPAAPNAPT